MGIFQNGSSVQLLDGDALPTGGTASFQGSHTFQCAVNDVIDVRIQKSTVSGTGILNNDGAFSLYRVH